MVFDETFADPSTLLKSRWYIFNDRKEDAKKSLQRLEGKEDGEEKFEEFVEAAKKEQEETVTYWDMITPGHKQFHPTVVTVMGQVNQALTGYGGMYMPRTWNTTP